MDKFELNNDTINILLYTNNVNILKIIENVYDFIFITFII